MRISDWSSDGCSSDLLQRREDDAAVARALAHQHQPRHPHQDAGLQHLELHRLDDALPGEALAQEGKRVRLQRKTQRPVVLDHMLAQVHLRRSEEHTSELQSLMRISYAVFCLKKKTRTTSIQP